MSYKILNSNVFLSACPPSGSLAGYLGTAASGDPAGWVICDGSSRSNSDNRYNNLIGLGIGSGTTGGTYTPPNLKAAFLRGTGTNSTSTYSGPSLKAFQQQQIINHGHDIPSHYHNTITTTSTLNFKALALNTSGSNTINDRDNTNNEPNLINLGINLRASSTGSGSLTSSNSVMDINYSGVNTGSETRPYNYGVYWILKL
jgi:hypothetical protein